MSCFLSPPYTRSNQARSFRSVQLLGSLFKQSLLIARDCLTMELMQHTKISAAQVLVCHVNMVLPTFRNMGLLRGRCPICGARAAM